jgi:hypothetical protein
VGADRSRHAARRQRRGDLHLLSRPCELGMDVAGIRRCVVAAQSPDD